MDTCNRMHVDSPTSSPSGKQPPTGQTSPKLKHVRLTMPQDQLDTLNNTMGQTARMSGWKVCLNDAFSEVMDVLCIDILLWLSKQLHTMVLKDTVQPNFTIEAVENLIRESTDTEHDLLVNGVTKGVVDNDWMTLIQHR